MGLGVQGVGCGIEGWGFKMRGEGVAVWAHCTDLIGAPSSFISHRVFLKSFGKSQIPHKSDNHI